MDIWSIVLSVVSGLGFPIMVFMIKQKYSENKQLKAANEKTQREEEIRRQQHEMAIGAGVVCLLRKSLMEDHATHMANGYISSKALESGLLMYKAYKDLGGNGMIDHMEEEIQELPIRD